MNIANNYEIFFQSPLVSDVENAPIYLLAEHHYKPVIRDLNARLINEKIESNSVLLVETYPSLQLVPETLKDKYIETYRIFDANKSDLTLLGWDEVSQDMELMGRLISGIRRVNSLISSVLKIKQMIGQTPKQEPVDLIESRIQEWRELLRDFELECNQVNEVDIANFFNAGWQRFHKSIGSLSTKVNRLCNLLKTFDKSDDLDVFKMSRKVKQFKALVLRSLKKFCVNIDKWKFSMNLVTMRISENMLNRTERMAETIEKIYNGQSVCDSYSKIFLIAGTLHLKSLGGLKDDPRFSLEGFYERMKSLPVVALIPKGVEDP